MSGIRATELKYGGAGSDPLLGEIELCTARSIAAGQDVATVGGFLAAIHPSADLIWLNFAVPSPDRAEHVQADDIDRLRAIFRSRGRRLRVEYFEALWPGLARLLEGRGLILEGRLPLMICSPEAFHPNVSPQVQVRELTAETDDDALRAFLRTAKAGFGIDPPAVQPQEIAEQRQYLQTGIYRSACAERRGQMIGVGSITPVNNELAGIATLPEFRRQGVAATVSSYLLERHFESGHAYAWLSAGGDAARHLYEKIGFRTAGTQLNYVDASPPLPGGE